MISLACFTEKSLFVVALVLVWATVGPHPLVIASPLMKDSSLPSSMSLSGSPLESKAGSGNPSSPEFIVVEDDNPITLDSLNKLVSNQPQIRMLRSFDSHDVEDVPVFNQRSDQIESDPRLARFLEQYFQSTNSNNRLPRRVGTSKRAAAMGVDLPDYILHINKGRNFDFSSFREKMQKSG